MKRLLVLFLIFFQQAHAQKAVTLNADSLSNRLPMMKNDTVKLNALSRITKYYQERDLDKSLVFAKQGLDLATALKSIKNICLFYNFLGEGLTYKGDYKASIEQYNKEYKIASQNNNKHYMAMAFSDMGILYEYQGDYSRAQEYFFKCLHIAESDNDIHLQQVCLLNISVVYINQDNFDKAIKYSQQTLQLIKQSRSKQWGIEAKAYELIGSSCVEQKKYTDARLYYNKALDIYTNNKGDMGIATMNSLLVSAYPDDYKMQLEYGFKAQAIWDKIAPKNLYAINNLGNIGIAYGDIARKAVASDTQKSISAKNKTLLGKSGEYLAKAIALAKETGSKQNMIELTDSLSAIEALTGKYKDAYDNLKIHNSLSDSIFSQQSKNKIASLEGKHEIELRDKQLKINSLELANQQKQRWVLLICIVALIFIAGLIYNQNVLRKKANAALSVANYQLEEADKIKNRFFGILNHDLRSPVSSFVNFLHLQQEAPDLIDENASAAYSKKAVAAAENLLDTMDDLLLWCKGQMENFKPQINKIPVELLFGFIEKTVMPPPNITMSFEQQRDAVLNTDEHYIKTIMLNLTNNAIKALDNKPGGQIRWSFREENAAKYLSVTDNGPGATDEQLKPLYDESATIGIKNGLGLHIVRDMAKAIGCQISVASEEGKGVEIKLKFRQ